MDQGNIPSALESEILEKAGQGWSTRRISEWLGSEKGVKASKSAVARLLVKTREFRADVAKAVVAEELRPSLTSDIRRLEELRADLAKRAAGLLQEDGKKLPRDNHTLYLKTLALELRVIDRKLRASGIDPEGVPLQVFHVAPELAKTPEDWERDWTPEAPPG